MKHFVIFDVNRPLFEENKILTANSPINAVKDYLKEAGINKKPKRSGSNYVSISAQEIVIKDGNKYYAGKPIQWYELTNYPPVTTLTPDTIQLSQENIDTLHY